MHVHRTRCFGPLIGEGHVRLGGRAVRKGDGHGVHFKGGIAFRHQLSLRADRMVAFRDGDGIAGELHAVRHVMHVHRARGFGPLIGEGHVRLGGRAVLKGDGHGVRVHNAIACRDQFRLRADRVIALRDFHGVSGELHVARHIMYVHRSNRFRPLIGEGHVGLRGRAVFKGDGHGVRVHGGIAFRHQLGFRADRVVAFRDGDGIRSEFHAVRHVVHVHRARGIALFIGEGHFRQTGLAVGERNAHRLHRDGLIVRRHQFFLGRDKIVAFGDGNSIRGKFLPVGYIMNLDLRPHLRLLIAEGNDGGLGLAVHERHLHRVGFDGFVAFGHILGLRGHHGFFGGDGHISAAEFRAVFIHIGYIHLRNAAQLHKVAHNVADLLFVILAEITDIVPVLAL